MPFHLSFGELREAHPSETTQEKNNIKKCTSGNKEITNKKKRELYKRDCCSEEDGIVLNRTLIVLHILYVCTVKLEFFLLQLIFQIKTKNTKVVFATLLLNSQLD